MKRALTALLVFCAVVAAGCGTTTRSSGSGTSGPASMAPASALAYASFEIAPQGSEKQGFDAAFGKLLGADPESKLGEAFTKAAQTSGKLDYATDVKPWLGDTLSVVVTQVGPKSADYALLAASTDDAKAQAAVDKDAGAGHGTGSYRGVSYDVLSDGTVNGVVDHYVVAGSESAFKAIVDTSKDGNSLADSDQWKQSVGNRADGKVGLAYVDAKALLESLASNLPGAQRLAAPLLLGMVQIHPFVATLDAASDSLIVDVSSPGTPSDPRGPAAASSPLIGSMPADAWLAAAVPQVGPALQKIVKALGANPLIGAQYTRMTSSFRAQTGIDVSRDLIATLGDIGVYLRGTTPQSVTGTLVVKSPRPARLAGTVRRLGGLMAARTGGRVHLVPRRGGFAVAGTHLRRPPQLQISQRTIRAAGPQLADTTGFKEASAVLGGRPTLYVDFARALELAAASPRHAGDQKFQKALPQLRHISYLAVGARRDGGLDVVRGVVGIH